MMPGLPLLLMTWIGMLMGQVKAQGACPARCFCDKALTSVNCDGKKYTSIPTNLPDTVEKLFMDHNSISELTNLSFAGLSNLKYVSLRNNHLTKMEPGTLAAVKLLDTLLLDTNNLQYLTASSVYGATNLKFLSIAANSLQHIPSLGYLNSLQKLILEGNKLNSPFFPKDFSYIKNLGEIVLSLNPLGNLEDDSFASLAGTNVKKMELSRCSITSISNSTFVPLKTLQSLKIGYNQLDATQLMHVIIGLQNSDIRSLNVANLSLGGILPTSTFAMLRNTSIYTLELPNNRITRIPDRAFADLRTLQTLDLSHCAIESMSPTALDNLTSLQVIFLNDNDLTEVPKGLSPSLTKLYLNGNRITTLADGGFSQLSELQELYLGNNQILELTSSAMQGLESLRVLHLSGNKISTLPGDFFIPLNRLQALELNNNNLKTIQQSPNLFSTLVSLTALNLANNFCENIPLGIFQPLQSLESLKLENNNLGGLLAADSEGKMFEGLSRLQVLYLFNNHISSLPEAAFRDLSQLTVLDLHSNQISNWGTNLFKSTPLVQRLDLSDNIISTINETSLQDLNKLENLNLSGNPFSCDCSLCWFRAWVDLHKSILLNVSGYRCNSPEAWHGKPLLSFSCSEINCRDMTIIWISVGAVSGFCVCFIVGTILYRHRWNLRFRWYRLKKALARPAHEEGYDRLPGANKAFDCYVCYYEEDWAWVLEHVLPRFDNGKFGERKFEGRLRLCCDNRDFDPGVTVIKNIVDAVDASKNAIVILTPGFCLCSRCEFEVEHLFSCKMNGTMGKIVVFKVGPLPEGKIPKILRQTMADLEFLEWTDAHSAEKLFIDQVEDILLPGEINNPVV